MASLIKPGWSKPSTILFATEIPANEKAFAFALAQAAEFGAGLILFHAYDTLVATSSETSGIHYYDYAAAARIEAKTLDPLAERVRTAGIDCEVVVRPGLPADQILSLPARARGGPRGDGHAFARTDRQAAGGLGGRGGAAHGARAGVHRGSGRGGWRLSPVCHADDSVRGSMQEASRLWRSLPRNWPRSTDARLVLQHVIRPQERNEELAGRSSARSNRICSGWFRSSCRERLTCRR
jgi:hypothetical protein